MAQGFSIASREADKAVIAIDEMHNTLLLFFFGAAIAYANTEGGSGYPRLYVLSVYGLAMSSSKLEEEASAIVITSDDYLGRFDKILTPKKKK